ncbi:hypothetical protein BCR36DRAFT_328797 [Piromyces finnis]|uniref:G-protein coupled receptors family 2 profile 2 domain-containing protein n=1 Tax=Piromyces finnis TaxID=1754191 RepID=A0A1Y1V7I4_9FUNG|nr:hypothetical protein BCR36DRAFT_328797 [Piromyces finnis]|eukprot:ORX48978.1 hypothetical protein BCR36DRAFT_328797 [Piromyces finnis]
MELKELFESKGYIIQGCIEVSAILSVVGSGAIIVSIICAKNFFGKNNIWNRLIFFMSLCDLCGSIDILLRKGFLRDVIRDDGQMCRIQGLTIQFFFISSILWTTAIAFNIFFVASLNKEIHKIENYEYIYHIIVWGLSLLLTLPLYIMDRRLTENHIMGNAAFWCWITSEYGKYRMIFFFGPLWTVFFFNLFVYFSTEYIYKERNKNTYQNFTNNSVAKRSDLYLLVLFLTWIWGTINRIQNIKSPDHPIFILYLLHGIFTPLQGFLNSIVYFWFSVIQHLVEMKKQLQNENRMSYYHNHRNSDIIYENVNYNPYMKTTSKMGSFSSLDSNTKINDNINDHKTNYNYDNPMRNKNYNNGNYKRQLPSYLVNDIDNNGTLERYQTQFSYSSTSCMLKNENY